MLHWRYHTNSRWEKYATETANVRSPRKKNEIQSEQTIFNDRRLHLHGYIVWSQYNYTPYNDTREDNTLPTTRARFNLIYKTDGAAVIMGSHDICMHNLYSDIDFWLLSVHEIVIDTALLLLL